MQRVFILLWFFAFNFICHGHLQAVTLFDFEDGIQNWTSLSGSTLSQTPIGANGTSFSLKCSKSGSGFGCKSPEIPNSDFSGFNAIILYRTQGNNNLASHLLINIIDKNGQVFSKRARWAKTNQTKLIITPFDLESITDVEGEPETLIDINDIEGIELFVSDFQVVNQFTETSFIIDEISLETLPSNPAGPFNPTITVDADNESGQINDRIYGVNLSFWDCQNGIRGSGSFGTGLFIKDNSEYEQQVINRWRDIYIPIHNDIGIKLLRWPGGLQANHYWWKDYIGSCNGIGPETRKGTSPPSLLGLNSEANPLSLAWAQTKFPFRHRAAIGMDEALQWAEDLGAEPLLMVNINDNIKTGGVLVDNNVNNLLEGDIEELANEAADLLEYCNAPDDGVNYGGGVDWASERSQNGHKAPYNVTHWELGNENWTITDPEKFGNVVAKCLDLMEERQSEIDVTTKSEVRDKMYTIVVDNGGSGGHLFTDEQWYSNVLKSSAGNVTNSERVDAWARHAYNNNSQCPTGGEEGKPCVSGLRLQNDLSSLEVDVNFPVGGDYRFWVYLQSTVNENSGTPSLNLVIDGELKGSYSPSTSLPQDEELLVNGITSGVHTIRFQPSGTKISPVGGISDSESAAIYIFPIVKAVNISTGEVRDFDLKNDKEFAKTWQATARFNADNFIEPISELSGKPPAITEWSSLLATGGGSVKYLAQDIDDNNTSLKGVTNRGDNILEPLGWVDYFFKFVEHKVDVACFHQLYEDARQNCLVEGVGEDGYTTSTPDDANTRELGRDDPRLRPTAMAFKMFAENYRNKSVFCKIEEAPKIETDWATSFQTSIENQIRFGVSVASSANWESGNNGAGLIFATGAGGGTFVGNEGSGILADTISCGAAMPDNNHLNLMVVNKEDTVRQITIKLNSFDPGPDAEVQILGVDANGNQIDPQTGTDPEHCPEGNCIEIITNPEGFRINNASSTFNYTLAPRSIHAIKLVRKGVDVAPPLAPSKLIADGTVDDSSVMHLSWSASEEAEGYNVYRSRASTGPFAHRCNVLLIKELSFDDENVFPEDLLYPGAITAAQWNYAVTSVDSNGNESGFSSVAFKSSFGTITSGAVTNTTPTPTPTQTVTLTPTPTSTPATSPTPTPSSSPESTPPPSKAFTFNCDRKFLMGPNGLEHLVLDRGEESSCILQLTNLVQNNIVKVATDVKAFSDEIVNITPSQGFTNINGDLVFQISGLQKGSAWVSWGIKDENGEFNFNRDYYKNGIAWGMFVIVR